MAKKLCVDILIPVYYKEAHILSQRVKQQLDYFSRALSRYDWKIIIANNGPRKDALKVAKQLAKRYPAVTFTDIDQPGRGWSLSQTWYNSKADIVMYMDADLATNLHSVPQMLDLLASNACDIAIGSRYAPGAQTHRTFHRNLLSKTYNWMLYFILGLKVLDAQCGFKGLKQSVARQLIPFTKDRKFFFDTELLYYAEKKGYRIAKIPVQWEEQKETSVQIISVVLDYIKNILRLLFTR